VNIIIGEKAALYVYLTVGLILLFAATGIHTTVLRRLFKKADIKKVDGMGSNNFEKYVAYLYQAQGYRVKHTGKSGDYGADVIVKKDNKTTVIQVKHLERHVGVAAVQQVHTAVDYLNADIGVIITNSEGFTKEAEQVASRLGIALIGRRELAEMIVRVKSIKLQG